MFEGGAETPPTGDNGNFFVQRLDPKAQGLRLGKGDPGGREKKKNN